MTPGAPTRADRIDELRADVFLKSNPSMPGDPDLTFRVDLGLKRRPLLKKETV